MFTSSLVISNATQFLTEGINIVIYQKLTNGNCGIKLGKIVFMCNLSILRYIKNSRSIEFSTLIFAHVTPLRKMSKWSLRLLSSPSHHKL